MSCVSRVSRPPHPVVSSSSFLRNSVCDSIMDVDEARSPGVHIYDKTNQQTSDLVPSVFCDTNAHGFLPPFRRLSVLSTLSVQSPPKEDNTWISVSPIEFAAKYSLLTFSSDWWSGAKLMWEYEVCVTWVVTQVTLSRVSNGNCPRHSSTQRSIHHPKEYDRVRQDQAVVLGPG